MDVHSSLFYIDEDVRKDQVDAITLLDSQAMCIAFGS